MPSYDRDKLARDLAEVRATTVALAAPLSAEDMQVQSMPDASPTKWHLAHTTWFFETFVLARHEVGFAPFHPDFGFLFNSYYEGVGPRPERSERGLLTRPALDEVRAYRAAIDGRMRALIARAGDADFAAIAAVTELGMHHEQQHQELLLTDAHHALWKNPLRPAYVRSGPTLAYGAMRESGGDLAAHHRAPGDDAHRAAPADGRGAGDHTQAYGDGPALGRVRYEGGLVAIGFEGDSFAFDNETPRHRVYVEPFAIASGAVTNGEYAAFVADGGYARSELWLSEGWATTRARGWSAPLYWERRDGVWLEHTLRGLGPIDAQAPVSHVSFYEADAYARWAGARLPTEAEWETVANAIEVKGNLLESGALTPRAADATGDGRVAQIFGDVWEWTASPYVGYPRFRPLAGALGEYNGKFMCNQLVLRGGSCFTPRSHVRATYRNFFPPDARWQMSGIRLAWWE